MENEGIIENRTNTYTNIYKGVTINTFLDEVVLEQMAKKYPDINIGKSLTLSDKNNKRLALIGKDIYEYILKELGIKLGEYIEIINIISIYNNKTGTKGYSKIPKKFLYGNLPIRKSIYFFIGYEDIRYSKIEIMRNILRVLFNIEIIKLNKHKPKLKEGNELDLKIKRTIIDYYSYYKYSNKLLGYEVNKNLSNKDKYLFRIIERESNRLNIKGYDLYFYFRFNKPDMIKDFIK